MARSTTPKTLGIVSICLGGVASLMSLSGLVLGPLTKDLLKGYGRLMDRLPQSSGQPNPGQMMDRAAEAAESVRGYQVAQSGGLLVLSLVLVAVGVGLSQRKPWSRKAALGWAVAALTFVPVMIWIQAGVIQPRTQAAIYAGMSTDQRIDPIMQVTRTLQTATSIVGTLVIYSPFPIVLLVVFGRKKSHADFAPERLDGPA